jgi:hypothetical protein
MARKEPAAHEGRHHRRAEPAGECGDLGLDAVAAHLDVDDDHAVGRFHAQRDFVGAFRERLGVDRAFGQAWLRVNLRRDHVARHFDIDRERALDRGAQHAIDLAGRARRIGEEGLVAGHLAIDRGLAVDRARLMVQQEAAHALARARRAGYDDHRRALRIRAGDRIDEVERTRPIGCDRDAEPQMIARRRIGGEADGRLMAQGEVRENPALLDHLVERQHEVARNAEYLARAMLLQARKQRLGKAGNGSLPDSYFRAAFIGSLTASTVANSTL